MFRSWHDKTRSTVFAGAFGAVALAALVAAPSVDRTTATQANVTVVPETVSMVSANPALIASVTDAVGTFVDGMAKHDAAKVWLFASEEDQAALETETAVYEAYADAFPQLTDVAEIHFGAVREEGDTPFVPAVVRQKDGKAWVADFGLWKNDAGDWTLISLDIKPASDNMV